MDQEDDPYKRNAQARQEMIQTLSEDKITSENQPSGYTADKLIVREKTDAGYKKSSNMERDGMTPMRIWGYSVGHFNNDLCASMWFVYLTYYLISVVGIPENIAAAAVLSGQFADGIMTPLVGIFSDMFDTPCGKRTPWYIFGTLFVVPTFLGIFIYPPGITDTDADGNPTNEQLEDAWYITLPALFNIGWASVQISNMSIVNTISKSNRMRDKLSNNRNGFTSTANIVVLGLATVLFLEVNDRIQQFRILAIICIVLGCCSSLFYLMQIREVPLKKLADQREAAYKRQLKIEAGLLSEEDPEERDDMTGDELKSVNTGKKWFDWLKVETFYIYGIVYMLVRVAINVTMTIQPFYITNVTHYGDGDSTPVQVAIVPLLSYIGQLFFSLYLQRKLTETLRNRFLPLLVALILITIGSFPLLFLNSNDNVRWLVYPLAFIQGLGLIIMLNTSTSLISDVIGNDSQNAAFVYGVYSLFDKLANGSLLFFMVASFSTNEKALGWIMALVPITCSAGALTLSYLGHKFFSHKLAKITGIHQGQ